MTAEVAVKIEDDDQVTVTEQRIPQEVQERVLPKWLIGLEPDLGVSDDCVLRLVDGSRARLAEANREKGQRTANSEFIKCQILLWQKWLDAIKKALNGEREIIGCQSNDSQWEKVRLSLQFSDSKGAFQVIIGYSWEMDCPFLLFTKSKEGCFISVNLEKAQRNFQKLLKGSNPIQFF